MTGFGNEKGSKLEIKLKLQNLMARMHVFISIESTSLLW